MYAEDSFFTLSFAARFGLVLVALLVWGTAALLLWRIAAGRALWLRLVLGVAIYLATLSVAPQIFYFYYIAIIEGLPFQNVLHWPPGPGELAQLLMFQGDASLATHGRGAMGWVMALVAILRAR